MDGVPDSLTEVLDEEGLAEHIARHGVIVDEILQVVRNGFKLSTNAAANTAEWVLEGDRRWPHASRVRLVGRRPQ